MMPNGYTLTVGYENGNADPHYCRFSMKRNIERMADVELILHVSQVMDEAERWCIDQFDERVPGGGWYRDHSSFHFGYASWAAAFKVRWG